MYFHVPFPEEERLLAIVARRAGTPRTPLTTLDSEELSARDSLKREEALPLVASAVGFFTALRKEGLRKDPSTAELIDWVRLLLALGATPNSRIVDVPDLVDNSLGTLVKTMEDLQLVQELRKRG